MLERNDHERALAELKAIQRLADEVLSSRDLDEVLSRCIDITRDVAQTRSGAIYLRDQPRGVFTRLISRESLHDQVHLPIDTVDSSLARSNSHLTDLEDPAFAGLPATLAARARGFRIVLTLGMRWRGQVSGLLFLAWREPIELPQSTINTLEALMGYQAAAIENARTKQLLEERARLAQMLLDFSGRAHAIAQEAELEALLLDTACKMAQAEGGVVARREPQGYLTAVARGAVCAGPLPVSDPIIATLRRHKSARLFDDLEGLPSAPLVDAARSNGYRALVALAIDDREHERLLLVGRRHPHCWNAEESEALLTLAQVGATALARCRVHASTERERRRLDAVLEHLPLGVVVVGHDARTLHANRAVRALAERFGAALDNYLDALRQVRRADGSHFSSLEESVVGPALAGQLAEARDVELLDAAGARRVLRLVAAPLHEPGQPALAVVGLSDVTELVDLAAAKDRFLRIASHELRSPVAALWLTAQLLWLDPSSVADETRRRSLDARLYRQAQRLVKLVGQLLDSARLSNDELPLEVERFDLLALARTVVEEAGSRVHLVHEEGEPLVGEWDRLRIEQVLSNLVGNALQYSEGEVELQLSPRSERICIAVRDHGIGIPASQLGQVFESFFRAAHSSEHHRVGMGLGLHICKTIVERHGGTIRVDSQLGVGSTFTVELPRRPHAAVASSKARTADSHY